MKTSEIRNKTIDELKELMSKALKDLSEARINRIQGKEKNLKKVTNLRKNVAKVITIMKEKQVIGEEK